MIFVKTPSKIEGVFTLGLSYPFKGALGFINCLAADRIIFNDYEEDGCVYRVETDDYDFTYKLNVIGPDHDDDGISDYINHFFATVSVVEKQDGLLNKSYLMEHMFIRRLQKQDVELLYANFEDEGGIIPFVWRRLERSEMKNVVCAYLEKFANAIKHGDTATLEWLMESSKITGFNIFDPISVVKRFPDLKEAEAFTLEHAA